MVSTALRTPIRRVLLLLLLSAGGPAAQAVDDATPPPAMQDVEIPLRLDYPLLDKLLRAEVFTGSGDTLDLLGTTQACNEIVLSDPQLSGQPAQLELRTGLRAAVGLGAPGACRRLLSFEGGLMVRGQPELRADGTALAFTPEGVTLLDAAGAPVSNATLEALAVSGVRTVFSNYQLDLLPQIDAVGRFLPEFLPGHSRQQIEALLATLRIAGLAVGQDAVDARISLSIEPVADAAPPERALSEAELALWEERWQAMDALIVLAVKHYAAATGLQELRDALLESLIESRYRLRDALAEDPVPGRDAVRGWFLQSWTALAPTLRRIGMEQPGQEQLLLVNVITATDALAALDELGPSFGLDISTDGLRRLARMINGDEGDTLLDYSADVDPVLRQLLEESLNAPPPPGAWRMDFSLFPKAFAADSSRLNSWAPKREDLPEYLPSVAALLGRAADDAQARRGLPEPYHDLFRKLVLTTAWQESCWRHYVVSDDRKLVPLRSGTGDVGLMQINERVWRGFYDQQRLRWDIDYNSTAGSEVLIDYLMKYALRKGEHRQPGGLVNLARASYSAYNGGPSQLSRYRRSDASAYGRKVDAAFWEKYQQVDAGNELAVSNCLGGNLSGPALPSAAGASGGAAGDGYVLQLGAFSSAAAARGFIEQNELGETARVRELREGGASRYLVVHGDFATRAAADASRAQFNAFSPWVRRLDQP
jgi:hypothetical protein